MLRWLVFLGLVAIALGPPARAEKARLVSENLPEFLREQLESDLPDEATPQTVLEARRQARRAAEAVQKRLNSLGYFDPSVDFAVEPGEVPVPMVRVDPGPRFTIGEIAIAYEDPAPSQEHQAEVRGAIQLSEGDIAVAQTVLAQTALLTRRLRELGYAEAEAGDPDILGDREAATIDVTYRVTSGPPIRFGELQISGNERTRDDYIERLSPIEPGTDYDPKTLATLNARLGETRIFSLASARIAPQPTGIVDGVEVRDIIVSLKERPRHTIALGASYSTTEGIGTNAEWTRRNLTGRGDALVVEATVASLTRSLEATWYRPNQFGYGRDISIFTGVVDETTDAFDRRAFKTGATLDLRRNPKRTFSLGADVELIQETAEQDEREFQLIHFIGAARIDESNSLLNPTQGWRADLSVAPTLSFGSTSSQYVRTVGQVSAYLPFNDEKFVFASRVRAGGILGAGTFDIPASDRFFAGGGGSVRGYAYQSIGERSTLTNAPIGGRYLLEGSVEGRYKVTKNISVVAFLDAGAVSPSSIPSGDELRYGTGLGVRYDTAVGPIRFDIATPLDRRDGEDPVLFYISIGQAF